MMSKNDALRTKTIGGGIHLKQHQLSDMSRPDDVRRTKFDDYVAKFRTLKVGSRLMGTKVNTGYNSKNKPVRAIGRLRGIKVDRNKGQIQVFLYDPTTNKDFEVYADSVEIITESHIKTFKDFLV
jgi:hypothetical protein